MKKNIIVLITLFITCSLYSKNRIGHTFMYTRPVYRNLAAQYNHANWQILSIYQQSTSQAKTKKFFLIDKQTSLIIKGDNATDSTNRNVRAEWLGLPDNFSGVMSINPLQQQAAAWLEYNIDVCKLCNCAFFDGVWFRASMPIQEIKNNINIKQAFISNPGNAPVADILQAFSQPAWLYGKFKDSSITKVAVGELMFKLGTTLLREDGFDVTAYSALVAPAYGATNPEYIFNPFIGNNNHWGFASGVFFQIPLTCTPAPQYWAMFFDIENITFFGNTQRRIIDIKNKPWSHYLLYNTLDGQINVPGVNLLTRKVSAKPYNIADLSTGFRFFGQNIQCEIAYNLWVHGNEDLKLKEKFVENFGIAGSGATTVVRGVTVGATASGSDIAFQAADDMVGGNPAFVPVRERDLDFKTGSSRSALTNRASANVYGYFGCDNQYYVGLGGHIEITQKNTALSTWAIWLNVGHRI